MIQIIFHAIGDYVTQNDWMANNKIKFTPTGWIACLIHCLLYSLPFLLIGSPLAFAVILGTHFLIDKFRLAKYWLKLVNWNWDQPNGFAPDRPIWLTTWILIIVDNTFHLICNYLALKYL